MVPTKIRPLSLTLSLPERMFQVAHLHVMENNLNHIILKSIHSCKSYGLDKIGKLDRHTHAHIPNCHDDPVSLHWLICKIPSYQTLQYLGIGLKHKSPKKD